MVLGKGFFNIFQAVELQKKKVPKNARGFFAAKQTRNNQWDMAKTLGHHFWDAHHWKPEECVSTKKNSQWQQQQQQQKQKQKQKQKRSDLPKNIKIMFNSFRWLSCFSSPILHVFLLLILPKKKGKVDMISVNNSHPPLKMVTSTRFVDPLPSSAAVAGLHGVGRPMAVRATQARAVWLEFPTVVSREYWCARWAPIYYKWG